MVLTRGGGSTKIPTKLATRRHSIIVASAVDRSRLHNLRTVLEGGMLRKLTNRLKMAAWAANVNRLVRRPPGTNEGFSAESIERANQTSFSRFSTWTILCEEVLDTQFASVYFEKAREELHRRGITDGEITEMKICLADGRLAQFRALPVGMDSSGRAGHISRDRTAIYRWLHFGNRTGSENRVCEKI